MVVDAWHGLFMLQYGFDRKFEVQIADKEEYQLKDYMSRLRIAIRPPGFEQAS